MQSQCSSAAEFWWSKQFDPELDYGTLLQVNNISTWINDAVFLYWPSQCPCVLERRHNYANLHADYKTEHERVRNCTCNNFSIDPNQLRKSLEAMFNCRVDMPIIRINHFAQLPLKATCFRICKCNTTVLKASLPLLVCKYFLMELVAIA